ncbi:MAG: hypothetical protein QOG96_4799, partial [Pseudonocardiales bacterium]|nr:hypothetical protein [Pseudonocardiales bacterium]
MALEPRYDPVMTDDILEPGTVRTGGSSARTRSALLRASGDSLAEVGIDHLDL